MDCIRCEVKRAKIVAHAMKLVGKNAGEIVERLIKTFGPNYFHIAKFEIDNSTTWEVKRVSKLPPYTPYDIITIKGKPNDTIGMHFKSPEI